MERNAKRFEVSGKFVQKGKEKKFSMEVSAVNENDAAEKVLALFGSRNRLKRRNIAIGELKEVRGEK
ncbi:MAG TPA: 50S ribosomal protein L18a [Candidatus Diapherotrites archaeon]|uniref:Large ribosomal subunit protein eL20 n=1 Tax=Candidatus Iainarchaeum sp. TaxID=3101447 RepID=A0A7J4IW50_9ARCH|nr:50S ribosomal protein L18a [Candidatus Diapherotrites archaeon]